VVKIKLKTTTRASLRNPVPECFILPPLSL